MERPILVFLWHRFIRLYPVHITILTALVVVVSFAAATGFSLRHPEEWQWSDLFWQITLLHAWGVTKSPEWNAPSWSISAEWFAYLLFPLLAPALVRVRDRGIALAIAVAALAATAALFTVADWTLNTWVGAPALARVFGEFLCGAALCRAVALGGELPFPSGDILGTGALLAFLFGASAGLQDFALVALLALITLGAAISQGHLARILGSRPLTWVGEISYSIYMVHFPILIAIHRLCERLGFAEWRQAGKICAFMATVALVVVLAAALFHFVERPARSHLRDRMGRLAPA